METLATLRRLASELGRRPAGGAALAAWSAAWRIALFILIWGSLLPWVLVPLARRMEETGALYRPHGQLALNALAAAAILAAAWIAVRFVDRRPFATFGLAGRRWGADFAAGTALGGALMALSVALAWASGWAERIEAVGFSWSALALMGAAVLLGALTEEVLVRGYMLQTLLARAGAWTSLVVSSILFALLHAGTLRGAPLPALNLFAAGIFLGLAYLVTRNLWLPIGIHFGWNLVQGPLLGLTVSGHALGSGWEVFRLRGPALATGGSFGIEGGLIATLTTGLGIAAVRLLGRRRDEPRPRGAEPDKQPDRAGAQAEHMAAERQPMGSEVRKSDEEWRKVLTPEQYEICRRGGTERAFTGEYWSSKEPGTYRCACCGSDLFRSDAKFDSGTGWPSFWEAVAPDRVELIDDLSHGMHRIEVRCRRCGAHLGHLFDDGPKPTGQRYCINSASLDLERRKGG